MSAWHREHPDLVGTDADPWMIHESYRKALPRVLTEESWTQADDEIMAESEREVELEARRLHEVDRPTEEDPVENLGREEWWRER